MLASCAGLLLVRQQEAGIPEFVPEEFARIVPAYA